MKRIGRIILGFIQFFVGSFVGTLIYVLFAGVDTEPEPGKMLLAFFGGGIGFVWFFYRRRESKRRKSDAAILEHKKALEEARRSSENLRIAEIEMIDASVASHNVALERNLRRAVKRNDYGAIVSDNRIAAIDEFLSGLNIGTALSADEARSRAIQQLKLQISGRVDQFNYDQIPADPTEFERWVATALSRNGWSAETTAGGADQGLDVIAKKSGRSVGIQCKLYSQPVGNRAVQEAKSGAAFYGLSKAAVVTNADFTRSAKELADAIGVALLHTSDLRDPDRFLL